jgi:hypothetical protein
MSHAYWRVLLVCLYLQATPCWAEDPVWTGVDRIVAIGDLHGDVEQFVKCLRVAKLVDQRQDWTGGKTHLLQLGDVLDRGPTSRQCLDLLMKLEPQAAAAGGKVHALIGNHETGVLRTGESRSATAEEKEAYGGPEQYSAAFGLEGRYGKWLRTHNAVIKINDILFSHSVLYPKFTKLTLAEINDAVRSQISRGARGGLVADAEGPLRDESFLTRPEADLAADLDLVLKLYGASHLVIGHAIDQQGVLACLSGRLLRIDVGLLARYHGPAACLLVEKGEFFELRAPDAKTKLDMTAPSPVRPPAPASR